MIATQTNGKLGINFPPQVNRTDQNQSFWIIKNLFGDCPIYFLDSFCETSNPYHLLLSIKPGGKKVTIMAETIPNFLGIDCKKALLTFTSRL